MYVDKKKINDDLDQSYPLTPRQSLMWIEDQLHPQIPLNNMISKVEIPLELDVELFKKAFIKIINRHEALRSYISDGSNGAVIYISPEQSWQTACLNYEDLSNRDDITNPFEDWLQHKCLTCFKPNKPLWEAFLVKLSKNHFVFFLNQHHCITDGVSANILIAELDEIYCSLLNNSSKPILQKEVIQSSAYNQMLVTREKVRLSEQGRRSEEYWNKRYSTTPENIEFYGYSYSEKKPLTTRIKLQLPFEYCEKVLALKPKLPPSILFTTVLFAWLHRITTNNDLCIGVPLLNREPDFKRTVGLLMEICPNRIYVDDNDSFSDLLAKVWSEIASAKPHRSHTVTSRNAKYEVMLNYRVPVELSFCGEKVIHERISPVSILNKLPPDSGNNIQQDIGFEGRESVTLDISHNPNSGAFSLAFDFNLGIWPDSEQRNRATQHFLLLIEHFLANPDQQINKVDILTTKEKSLMLSLSNILSDEQKPWLSVIAKFTEQVKKTPEAIAIEYENQKVSYSQLATRVAELSAWLASKDIGQGLIVALYMDRSPELIATVLAIMHIGSAYVPIDPNHSSERLSLVLEDAQPNLVLCDSDLMDQLKTYYKGELSCTIEAEKTEATLALSCGNSGKLAYIIFTSGSTGRPKGVEILHHGLSTFLEAMISELAVSSKDHFLSITTLAFDISIVEMFLPLIIGARVKIVSHATAINGEALTQLITNSKTSFLQATPTTYRMLISAGWHGNDHIKLLSGGEAITPELAKDLIDRSHSLWNGYGPTETTIYNSVFLVKRQNMMSQSVPLGTPISGSEFIVLNSHHQRVPIGVTGELFIAGIGLAQGYKNRQDTTLASFINLLKKDNSKKRVYKTGDRVRFLPEIGIEYKGRNDNQVKIRGFRIELEEIESVLNKFPHIEYAGVFIQTDEFGEPRLIAGIKIQSEIPDVDMAALRQFLKVKLPAYMLPALIFVVDSMPLTSSGKIDRKTLAKMTPKHADMEYYASISSGQDAPSNDLELMLSQVWARVLKLPKVGVRDNFFDLGGYSILTLTLVTEMEKATGIKFGLGDVFRAPTIYELIANLDDNTDHQRSAIVSLQSEGDNPALFCLLGIYLYKDLAETLGTSQPVYGIYLRQEEQFLQKSLQGKLESLSMTELAEAYADTIMEQSVSDKPVQLAGISFGGLVAIRTAQILLEKGVQVSLVILLDTNLVKPKPSGWYSNLKYCVHLCRKVFKIGSTALIQRLDRPGIDGNDAIVGTSKTESQNLHHAYLTAMNTMPSDMDSYAGDVLLIKARDRAGLEIKSFPHDYGWGKVITGQLFIHEVPGGHIEMLRSPHVKETGDLISKYLALGKTMHT